MATPATSATLKRPVKIVIADDHAVIRKMVSTTLKEEPGFDVIGEAENGLQAVHKAEVLRPDVVVLNIKMPVLDGFEAARRIRKTLPEIAIVILSSEADRRFIEEAKKIGARAFVPKTEAAIGLVKAIDAALRNDAFFVVE
jgi:two-component system nitrate/nitrite response regulator NarL